jgi:hypothetical protein
MITVRAYLCIPFLASLFMPVRFQRPVALTCRLVFTRRLSAAPISRPQRACCALSRAPRPPNPQPLHGRVRRECVSQSQRKKSKPACASQHRKTGLTGSSAWGVASSNPRSGIWCRWKLA